jgi:hypothetical protein
MQNEAGNQGIYQNGFVNFTEYFATEKDVWIRNIGNTQISLEFDAGNGNKIGECIPRVGDPTNLSQRVPWDAIKNSPQFRNLVNRSPRIMILMLPEQAMEFFRQKATRNGRFIKDTATNEKVPDVRAMMEDAEKRRKKKLTPPPKETTSARDLQSQEPAVRNFDKPASAQELDAIERGHGPGQAANLGQGDVRIDDIVNGRVMYLCNQVSYELSPEQRMPAKELLEELDDIRDQLTMDDFNHVMSFGGWPTVKSWARAGAAELASREQNYEEPGGEAETAAPVTA